METIKEWAIDIALMLLVGLLTAGLESRHRVGVSCGAAPAVVQEAQP